MNHNINNPQQTQSPPSAPQPVGFAPVYQWPPLAKSTGETPPVAPSGSSWDPGIIGNWAIVISAAFCLGSWGTWLIADQLYGGAQVRELQRKAREAEAIAAQRTQVIQSVQGLVCPSPPNGGMQP